MRRDASTPVSGLLDEKRLARFASGEEHRAYELLGAHLLTHDGVPGARFAVWAPNATAVSLPGSFNGWDGVAHPMSLHGATGVWELFVPSVEPGTLYKFEVQAPNGERLEKADPFGFAMELRPATASLVWSLNEYQWNDDEWLARRSALRSPEPPISIYEVHLGSWRRAPGADPQSGYPGWLSYRELAEQLLPYVVRMGYTHVELLPVTEHPLDQSWGYQTVGYFAPTSRYGTPDDFRFFVDRAHQLGIGVILDWAPAHFPRDDHGLARFDGTFLYEHEDPQRGEHPDWGTAIFDYGRPEVAAFLISSALFWIDQYHVDGIRVDAVASMLYLDYSRDEGEWTPNIYGGRENLEAVAFLRRLNDAIHAEHAGVLMIAEESTSWPRVSWPARDGGLGFDMKWNMGWMNDTLSIMQEPPALRRARYEKLSFSLLYAFTERFLLPLSHDEVVHLKRSFLSKMPGDPAEKFANLRLLYGYLFSHPGKKLLFMGGELGELREWAAEGELEWSLLDRELHAGLKRWVEDLNALYVREAALHELDFHADGFEWVDCHDPQRGVLSFLRWASDWRELIAVVANFGPAVRDPYRLGVPVEGAYELILSSEAAEYGGEGESVPRALEAERGEVRGRPAYLELSLPPCSLSFLKKS